MYARSFAWGKGFQYLSGVQEAGSTSPLWSIVTAPVHWFYGFGIQTLVVLVKSIAAFCGLLFLLSLQRIARHLTQSRWVGVATASLIAFDPRLLFAIFSGMETPLLIALWGGALAAGLRGRPWIGLLLWSLMPVTRPEALLLLPLGAFLFWPYPKETVGPLWKNVARVCLGLGLPMSGWMLFCLYSNGHLLPNTFYIKASSFSLGWKQVVLAWSVTTQHGWSALPLFSLGLLGFLLFGMNSSNRSTLFVLVGLFLAPLVYLFGVVSTRELYLTGYYWTRWADPASLLFTAASCFGFVWLGWWAVLRLRSSLPKQASLVVSGLSLILIGAFVQPWSHSFQERRHRLAADSRAIFLVNTQTALWLKKHTSPKDVIGVNDAGVLRFLSGRKVIDLIGLNDKRIAFDQGAQADMIRKMDWLAIFPHVFTRWSSKQALQEFKAVFAVGIPFREYTPCPCPGQERIILFRRKQQHTKH